MKSLQLTYLNKKPEYHSQVKEVVTTSKDRHYYFHDREGISYKSVSSYSKNVLPKYLIERFQNKGETQAMKNGTLVHLFLENYFKQEEEIKVSTALAVHCRNITNYIENHFTAIHMLEEVVRSDQYQFAGRIDFLGECDGLLTLVDFKTANSLYKMCPDMLNSYIFQLACYSSALIESGFDVKQVMLIRSLPEPNKYNIVRKPVNAILPIIPKYLGN